MAIEKDFWTSCLPVACPENKLVHCQLRSISDTLGRYPSSEVIQKIVGLSLKSLKTPLSCFLRG